MASFGANSNLASTLVKDPSTALQKIKETLNQHPGTHDETEKQNNDDEEDEEAPPPLTSSKKENEEEDDEEAPPP